MKIYRVDIKYAHHAMKIRETVLMESEDEIAKLREHSERLGTFEVHPMHTVIEVLDALGVVELLETLKKEGE